MKQKHSTELSGYSFNDIYNKNGPPDTPRPQIRIFAGFSGVSYGKPAFFRIPISFLDFWLLFCPGPPSTQCPSLDFALFQLRMYSVAFQLSMFDPAFCKPKSGKQQSVGTADARPYGDPESGMGHCSSEIENAESGKHNDRTIFAPKTETFSLPLILLWAFGMRSMMTDDLTILALPSHSVFSNQMMNQS